jgi:hypothetical protein
VRVPWTTSENNFKHPTKTHSASCRHRRHQDQQVPWVRACRAELPLLLSLDGKPNPRDVGLQSNDKFGHPALLYTGEGPTIREGTSNQNFSGCNDAVPAYYIIFSLAFKATDPCEWQCLYLQSICSTGSPHRPRSCTQCNTRVAIRVSCHAFTWVPCLRLLRHRRFRIRHSFHLLSGLLLR